MKLFKSLLVAPAALGLLAPVAATANEVTINDFNAAEEIAVTNSRLDSLEVQVNEFEAGGFSDTTTLDGKVAFSVGAIEDADGVPSDTGNGEGLMAAYSYTANLNTSFTGDDNLYVRIKAGNAADWMSSTTYGTYLSSAKGSADALAVDKIWYEFPVGESGTVWVGPKIENYYMHATTPSIYKPVTKQFTLGGNGAAYGASTNSGFGLAYNADNGFAVSTNFVSKQNGTANGLFTNQAQTSWATQVGITKPQYSASLILNQKYNGWTDSYFSTASGLTRGGTGNSTNLGLRGWWRPLDSGTLTPSVSLGLDISDIDGVGEAVNETSAYFLGLNWTDIFQADDRLGLALGQPQKVENESTDPFAWEAYYSFKVNDSITVTPTVFGTSSRDSTTTNDITGFVVDTVLKF
ncbi:iron uptake porin [Prochlorococcus sp. AH-736-D21]|nr:iron uptake porin [Prochlorococcus sp. AH-736-D21]